MDQSLWKYIVTFAAGAGVGFFVTRKLLEDHYAELAQEEIDSVKENLGRRNPNVVSYVNNVMKEESKYEVKSSLDETYTNGYNKVKHNYGIVSDDIVAKAAASYDGDTVVNSTFKTEEDSNNPYVISDEEFADEMPHFDKVTLYYYMTDDILTDDNEEPIVDIDDVIGYDALVTLGNEQSNTIWVRNNRISTDYEVVRLNQSYQESVLGIKPEPPIRTIERNREDEY